MRLEAENAALRAQVSELPGLREQVTVLLVQVQVQVQHLEARQAKDKHSSSKTPSSGGLRRKTKRPRKKSGKNNPNACRVEIQCSVRTPNVTHAGYENWSKNSPPTKR
jgi:hypothetical protein